MDSPELSTNQSKIDFLEDLRGKLLVDLAKHAEIANLDFDAIVYGYQDEQEYKDSLVDGDKIIPPVVYTSLLFVRRNLNRIFVVDEKLKELKNA